MTDYFALLEEPRRPGLDLEGLKAKFLRLTAESHPDRSHSRPPHERQKATERYTELNAAYQCLREPKDRWLHLYLLEAGVKPEVVQEVPSGLTNLFFDINQIFRTVDAFLVEKAKILSPILKAQSFAHGLERVDKLKALQQELDAKQALLLTEAQALNARWDAAPAVGAPERSATLPLVRLEELHRTISYLSRWSSQARERVAQLSF